MKLETRLITMKQYLAEALLSPEENKLYIEDLNLSIAHFEKYAMRQAIPVMNGIKLDD